MPQFSLPLLVEVLGAEHTLDPYFSLQGKVSEIIFTSNFAIFKGLLCWRKKCL